DQTGHLLSPHHDARLSAGRVVPARPGPGGQSRLMPLGSRPIPAEPLGISRLVLGGSTLIDSGATGATPSGLASGGLTFASPHPTRTAEAIKAAIAEVIRRERDRHMQLPPQRGVVGERTSTGPQGRTIHQRCLRSAREPSRGSRTGTKKLVLMNS